jgi:hypothetical protein
MEAAKVFLLNASVKQTLEDANRIRKLSTGGSGATIFEDALTSATNVIGTEYIAAAEATAPPSHASATSSSSQITILS